VRIADVALVAAANLSDRYVSDRFLPDKAIDLVGPGIPGVGIPVGRVRDRRARPGVVSPVPGRRRRLRVLWRCLGGI